MHHSRRAAKVDDNQKSIVNALRKIPSITVAVGHDDCLVGFQGKTYWYEIKNVKGKNKLQPSQEKLIDEWKGHYKVVTCLDDILRDLKIIK